MTTLRARPDLRETTPLRRLAPAWVTALGILVASAYGALAAHPYAGVPEATVTAGHAQDVCSLAVAVALPLLARSSGARAHLVALGLHAYVAYSYAIYLVGLPVNRAFLVYVVLVASSGAALLDGVVRLRPREWLAPHGRVARGTGWLLLVVAVLFASLWLTELLPFTLGGERPAPTGPGGAAYPVYVLDLTVVLPLLALVGAMLLRGAGVAAPLTVVCLVKILTLFTVLWVGVAAGLVRGDDVHVGADAVPSLLMMALCAWLLRWWWAYLRGTPPTAVRPTFWDVGA